MPPRIVMNEARIRELLRQGVKPAGVARRTGASQGSVYRVLRKIKEEKR